MEVPAMPQPSSFTVAQHKVRPIPSEAVRALYEEDGWWPDRRTEDIANVLRVHPAVGVWDGDHLIAFARAVTDGCFRAYIEDVVVHPQYRRIGIARLLLAELLSTLVHIETVSLFCQRELAPLYEQLGFVMRGSQVVLHRSRPG